MMLPPKDVLDRDKLHFFVAGPGQGEGLAIALPRPHLGWIFVDGCRTDAGEHPLHEIWRQYRLAEEKTECIVLTHPHKDHYAGMVELIDLTDPVRLACVATHHRSYVRALRDDPVVEDYPHLLTGPVKELLARIQNECDWNGKEHIELRAGRAIPLHRTDVTIRVVGPDSDGARTFFAHAGLAGRLRTRANEISAVLEIRYGKTRLVLGGDLPELDHGAGPVTGWTRVLSSYPDLPGSRVLKIPHHGSDGAMHTGMVGAGAAPAGACWVLTPFQGGAVRPLPQLQGRRGVERLLEGIDEVHLTSLPAGWTTARPLDDVVPLNAIQPPPPRTIPGARYKAPMRTSPTNILDAVWLLTLDDTDRCICKHAGVRALRLGPRAPASARSPRPAPPTMRTSRG